MPLLWYNEIQQFEGTQATPNCLANWLVKTFQPSKKLLVMVDFYWKMIKFKVLNN